MTEDLGVPFSQMERTLDSALRLESSGAGAWSAVADPNYESSNGLFGGWTVAMALRVVSASAAGDAEPSVINVNFIDRIDPGTNLIIRTRRIGGSRAVSHWLGELMSEGEQATLASASVMLADRRPSDEHTEVKAPRAPDPDTLTDLPGPG